VQSHARLRLSVMRFSAPILVLLLAGCATSPRDLCAQLVPSGWTYIGPDEVLEHKLEDRLPQEPFVRHVWYRRGENKVLACTFGGVLGDPCSVATEEFELSGESWSNGAQNAVLCNVVPE
jgi:hypothetical protein